MKKGVMSPTLVQRDFGRIIRQIGTPAKPPKPRYISPGRRKGTKLTQSLLSSFHNVKSPISVYSKKKRYSKSKGNLK
jgi:hypothetical protein